MARKLKIVKKSKTVPPKSIPTKRVSVKPPGAYETEIVDASTLKPHPRNYKGHPADQLTHIGESLKQFGFYRNIVVARDQTILAGHGLVEAAKLIGFLKIPIRRMPFAPDDPRAMKILALDNEIGKFGEVDDRSLSEILKGIRDTDEFGLLGTGYDDASLAAFLMVTRPASEIKDLNAAGEWLGMPDYEPGGPQYKLIIAFKNEADRKQFSDRNEIVVDKMERYTWSTRWPFTRREDASSVRFEAAPK